MQCTGHGCMVTFLQANAQVEAYMSVVPEPVDVVEQHSARFRQNLRHAMDVSSLNREELAVYSKVSYKQLRNILSGENSPTERTITKMCVALGLNPGELWMEPMAFADMLAERAKEGGARSPFVIWLPSQESNNPNSSKKRRARATGSQVAPKRKSRQNRDTRTHPRSPQPPAKTRVRFLRGSAHSRVA